MGEHSGSDKDTHGICDPCKDKWLKDTEDSGIKIDKEPSSPKPS